MGTGRDVETVERLIAAPPDPIFELLANPARHREIDGSGTLVGSTGDPQRLFLGATFGMDMKAGFRYSMLNTVVEFEEGRRIAWQPRPRGRVLRRFAGGRIWRYELVPSGSQTLVRESWDISNERCKLLVKPLRRRAVSGMKATLARIEQLVAH